MAYAQNSNGFSVLSEADPVVAYAKTKLSRVDPLELLDVPAARFGESFDGKSDTARECIIERGHIVQGGFGPFDLPH